MISAYSIATRYLTLLCAAVTLSAVAKASKPNVLFILVDDLGYSDIGCYGGEIETPHIDSIARNGLRFTQFYNTGRCWPSRAALMTGYYPHQVHRDSLPGIRGGFQGKRQTWARMLPDFLAPFGYRSYHSGKWHLDGKAADAGFQVLDSGRLTRLKASGDPKIDGSDRDAPKEQASCYWSDDITDHAIAHLRDHANEHADKPFFQYLAFHAPHFPLRAAPEDIAKYQDAYLEGWDKMRERRFARMTEMKIIGTELSLLEPEVGPPYEFPDAIKQLGPGEVTRPLPWNELTEEQQGFQATKMAIHAAMVDRVDQQVGRVIAQLKVMGQFENTVIFFASDNGASAEIMIRGRRHDPNQPPGSALTYLCLGPGFSSACNTPFRRHKVWTHEGGIATPLVVHWPARIKARGELRHTPGHFIDIVPTILELAGIEKPKTWEGESIPPAPGRSLFPAFSNDVPIERDSLWWLHEDNRAIRVGDWKLVASKGEPWELYDLRTDRAEAHNLAKKQPEHAQELEKQWDKQKGEIIALAKLTNKEPEIPEDKTGAPTRPKRKHTEP